ncbi:hypothetical protein VTP01DRAFT_2289 [Rhizomucor pusillus]|uniref:uncharacterized protein n=1 Tax=Rhizomucor pusillus TaxID=4840 RepID=UPI00374288B6
MENAPIHKSEDIDKYIESHGYRYAYLPSYSPDLNPIEQFCEASESLGLIDFEGFVAHSHKCLDKCHNGEQL